MDKSILKSIADTFNGSVYVYNGDQIQSQYNDEWIEIILNR